MREWKNGRQILGEKDEEGMRWMKKNMQWKRDRKVKRIRRKRRRISLSEVMRRNSKKLTAMSFECFSIRVCACLFIHRTIEKWKFQQVICTCLSEIHTDIFYMYVWVCYYVQKKCLCNWYNGFYEIKTPAAPSLCSFYALYTHFTFFYRCQLSTAIHNNSINYFDWEKK